MDPSCYPGFKSQAQHQRFFILKLKNEKRQKEAVSLKIPLTFQAKPIFERLKSAFEKMNLLKLAKVGNIQNDPCLIFCTSNLSNSFFYLFCIHPSYHPRTHPDEHLPREKHRVETRRKPNALNAFLSKQKIPHFTITVLVLAFVT